MADEVSKTPYERALALRAAGMSNEEVLATLTAEGVEPDSARMLIAGLGPQPAMVAQVQRADGTLGTLQLPPDNSYANPSQAARSAGLTQIGIGVVMVLVGGGITLATYSAATGPSGGTYLLMWGPMIFGTIRIFKGIGMLGGS